MIDKPQGSPGSASPELLGYLAGCGAAFIWGAWPVVSAIGMRGALTPYDVTALRFLTAGLLLSPVLIRRGFGGLGWRSLLLLAGGAGAPYTLLGLTGIQFTPASHAGIVIPSSTMLFSTIGGAIFLHERLSRQRLLGIAIIVSGAALIFLSRAGAQGKALYGETLFVLGGVLWGAFTITARAKRLDALHAAAIVSVISMAVYLPPYFVVRGLALIAAPPAEIAIQMSYQGIFSGIGALAFYTFATTRLGATRAGLFPTLAPVLAVGFAWAVLGETPGIGEIAGVFLVSIGMIVGLARKLTFGRHA